MWKLMRKWLGHVLNYSGMLRDTLEGLNEKDRMENECRLHMVDDLTW